MPPSGIPLQLDALLAWCEQHGVKFGSIQAAAVTDGGRGVVATGDIAVGEVLMEVPEQLLLSRRSAERDPQLGALLRMHTNLDPYQVLSVHLLHEVSKAAESLKASQSPAADSATTSPSSAPTPDRHVSKPGAAASFWAPYLKELPKSYTNLCNFSQEAIASLQAPHAQETAQEAVDKALDQWRGALPLMQQLGLPRKYTTRAAWLWATATLLSRTMYVPYDAAGALMPFGDLHNYQPPPPPYTPIIVQRPKGQQHSEQQQLNDQRQEEQAGVHPFSSEPAVGSCSSGEAAAAAAGGDSCAGGGNQHQQQHQEQPVQPRKDAAHAAGADAHHEEASGGGPSAAPGTQPPQPPVSCQGSCVTSSEAAAAMARITLDDDGAGSIGHHVEGAASLSAESEPAEAAATKPADQSDGMCGDGSLDEASGTYKLYARRRYAAADQIYLCYGRHTNLELLECYGFTLHEDINTHEQALLPLEVVEAAIAEVEAAAAAASSGRRAAHRAAARSQAYASAGASQQHDYRHRLQGLAQADCFVHANGHPSWQLLCALRSAAASQHERRTCAQQLACGERVSVEGDVRALSWLRAACQLQLSSLPTPLEEDERLLEQMSGHEGPSMACEQRQEEQRQGSGAGKDLKKDVGDGGSSSTQAAASTSTNVGFDECLALAVQWRAGYKRILAHCIKLSGEWLQQLRH